MSSAFRHFGIAKKFWKYLLMKAQDPKSGTWYYFVDKAMPFGSAVSCAHFQVFSDAISHVITVEMGFRNVNYLDDYFFVAWVVAKCNGQIRKFIQVCRTINFPVALNKTVWGTTLLTFLGLMIDTRNQKVIVPADKVAKALGQIEFILTKRNRKITLRKLQEICGLLNFISKAVVPGRVFNRRLYAKGAHLSNQNHHLYVDAEMKRDLKMWRFFLERPESFARGFFDFASDRNSKEINFYTDASTTKGCGGAL